MLNKTSAEFVEAIPVHGLTVTVNCFDTEQPLVVALTEYAVVTLGVKATVAVLALLLQL
jgi:hypothetical protein